MPPLPLASWFVFALGASTGDVSYAYSALLLSLFVVDSRARGIRPITATNCNSQPYQRNHNTKTITYPRTSSFLGAVILGLHYNLGVVVAKGVRRTWRTSHDTNGSPCPESPGK
ncbi:hypothetical protein K440DRAFT_427669 [Wilcoxina mikolae CBS 423.85]|nr:hypothetical protein K440DRAFT_427669 [Wilcoxina mikolae CBS 423.85]